MRVLVTGSSGKIGRAACAALKAAGHKVTRWDIRPDPNGGRTLPIDCTDFGAVMGALSGIDMNGPGPDAIIHLAGIPAPALATDHRTFEVNTLGTYNVFSAATRLGIQKIIWASSETILGLPFTQEPPLFVPVDETHPDRPNWSYALSKHLGEQMADAFVRWNADLTILSLRFSNVFVEDDYAQLESIQADPAQRRLNLWSYVDARDAGEACRLAAEADIVGHHRMLIAAADTLMAEDSHSLVHRYFPEVPITQPLSGHDALLSSSLAADTIGYTPLHSWRDKRQSAGQMHR